jgi:hypothetical protein
MSEHNIFPLFVKENLRTRPQDFSITDADIRNIEQAQAARRAAHDKANPPDAKEQRKEYNRLLNDHFNLKQWVRGCEVRVNESAGQIRNIEQRLNSLIIEKQQIESPLGQRNIEHAIVRLEGELADEKAKYEALRKENIQAVRQLKSFDVTRLEALKAELDAPKVVSK